MHLSLTRVALDVVVDDLLAAVGEVDVVGALGVLAVALLLVAEARVVGRHRVTEPVVRGAAGRRECYWKIGRIAAFMGMQNQQ